MPRGLDRLEFVALFFAIPWDKSTSDPIRPSGSWLSASPMPGFLSCGSIFTDVAILAATANRERSINGLPIFRLLLAKYDEGVVQ